MGDIDHEPLGSGGACSPLWSETGPRICRSLLFVGFCFLGLTLCFRLSLGDL